MSIKLYVYSMGIIDFFDGMMPLQEMIWRSPEKSLLSMEGSLCHRALKKFLVTAFLEAYLTARWEGDVRSIENVAISAIPRPTANLPYLMVAFKQNNNGESFLVSETKIHISDEDKEEGVQFLLASEKFSDHRDMHVAFLHCYDLVEHLFDVALTKKEWDENTKGKNPLIHKIKIVDSKVERFDIPESKEKENFDLKNYEPI